MPGSPSVLVWGLIPEILVQVMKEDFTGENRYYRHRGSIIAVSHIWEARRFQTRDTSTNNWWVALLSFGDGWDASCARSSSLRILQQRLGNMRSRSRSVRTPCARHPSRSKIRMEEEQ
jgi:hypothetical protein